MIYDCAVIGAGCFGAWTALRLRETGRSVALVEAFEPGHSRASSGGASREIRMGYGSDRIYTRWAAESLAEWRSCFDRVNRPELFQRTGVLWTAPSGHPHAEGTRAAFAGMEVPHELLSTAGLRARYPQFLIADGMEGILEPESGAILANRAVQAVVERAVETGVVLKTARVLGPLDPTVRAATLVFACGPWLPKVFPEILGGRIRVTRQEVFYFAPPPGDRRFEPPAMPVWIDFSDPRGGYFIPQVAGKGLKLALDQHGPEFDPDTGSRMPTPEGTAAAREFLAERCPGLASAALLEAEVCQYENTSSGDFLIDRHPELDHVWLVGGGSGHGFKHGPAVGSYVANLLDGRCEQEARFSLESKKAVHQRQVF